MIVFVLILRIFLPLLFFKWPFGASLANFILDSIDGDLLTRWGIGTNVYQIVDKSLDYFAYIVMFIIGSKWAIKKEIIVVFLIRTIGQILFFSTGNEIFFFFFPNFLGPLFIFFAFLLVVKKSEAYLFYKKNWVFIWGGIFVYKFLNEWLVHVLDIDFSEYLFGKMGLLRLKK